MKKIICLFLTCLFIAACAPQGKEEEVNSFWDQQWMYVQSKLFGWGIPMGKARMSYPENTPAVPAQQMNEQEIQQFEEMMKNWEQEQTGAIAQEEQAISQEEQAVSHEDQGASQEHAGQLPPPPPAVAEQAGKEEPQSGVPPRKRPARRNKHASHPSNQVMEITMEEPSGVVQGKAPLKDRQAMQNEIDKVLQENQNTIQDIGRAFGMETQADAFVITTKTEKALRRQAAASISLQEYLKVQKQLLRKQEQSLNQLMQNNAQKLGNIQ